MFDRVRILAPTATAVALVGVMTTWPSLGAETPPVNNAPHVTSTCSAATIVHDAMLAKGAVASGRAASRSSVVATVCPADGSWSRAATGARIVENVADFGLLKRGRYALTMEPSKSGIVYRSATYPFKKQKASTAQAGECAGNATAISITGAANACWNFGSSSVGFKPNAPGSYRVLFNADGIHHAVVTLKAAT